MEQNSHNFWNKSPTLKIFIFLLIFFITFPKESTQQTIIDNSSVIETHCMFSYDQQNRYSCFLFMIHLPNPNDVLNIVGEHLLDHTDDDVVAVVHIQSRINQFNGEILRRFVNLRFINLQMSGLQSINPTAFDVCGRLEELNIGGNHQLTELPPQMLRNCGNFRIFRAVSSRFPVSSDLFGNTRNLEEFVMTSSILTSFPDNLLRNMVNLRVFNVWSNRLAQLSPNNFINARNLEVFDIGLNRFSDAQAVMSLLNGHFELKRIVIVSNPFPMFNFNFFSQFQNLEELEIFGNPNLPGISWQSLPSSLIRLRVDGVNEELPENAFWQLRNLEVLRLSGFAITNLQPNAFRDLTSLTDLSITDTNITTLPSQLFANQEKLILLNLMHNRIEEFPDGVFVPLINLGNTNATTHGIFMSGNRLSRLSANSFGQHPHLRRLFFSHNRISKIQRGIFSRFSPVLLTVDFFHNECIHSAFFEAENLDGDPQLEWCFNNFEGITTTTPGKAGRNFREFEIFTIIFVGFVKVLVNIVK